MSYDENKTEGAVEQVTMFRSFFEAAKQLSDDRERGIFYHGILAYAFSNGKDRPAFPAGMMKMAWTTIQPILDKSLHMRRPGNQSAKKKKNANETQMKRNSNANTFYEKEGEIEGEIEREIEKEIDSHPHLSPSGGARGGERRFSPPSVEEVAAYCDERGNGIDAQEFFDHYEMVGWKVGKSPMKDWRAAVRTWEAKRGFRIAELPPGPPPEVTSEPPATPEQLRQLQEEIFREFVRHE